MPLAVTFNNTPAMPFQFTKNLIDLFLRVPTAWHESISGLYFVNRQNKNGWYSLHATSLGELSGQIFADPRSISHTYLLACITLPDSEGSLSQHNAKRRHVIQNGMMGRLGFAGPEALTRAASRMPTTAGTAIIVKET